MTTFVWIGPIGRFGVTNDLGTAANWTPVSVPTATDSLIFSSRPGLLTGTAQGLNADFSGVGTWNLSGAQLTLAGLLTVDGTLSTSLASVTAGSVAVNAGATLSGSGTVTGAITDNGTIMASGGLLTLSGAVGGTGLLQIDVGATLDVKSASAGETISFLGSTGTLVDHQGGTIGAAISGFVAGDTIRSEFIGPRSGCRGHDRRGRADGNKRCDKRDTAPYRDQQCHHLQRDSGRQWHRDGYHHRCRIAASRQHAASSDTAASRQHAASSDTATSRQHAASGDTTASRQHAASGDTATSRAARRQRPSPPSTPPPTSP